MRVFRIFVVIILCFVSSTSMAAKDRQNPFLGVHTDYKVKEIGHIKINNLEHLTIELATKHADEQNRMFPISRVQLRNERGFVVAYTPTRGQAITFCRSKSSCWVFLWKTVYPLPAIFKFETDQQTWIREEIPPMIYSRSGNDGYGFKDVTNPIFGLFGLMLFFFQKIVYFTILIVLTALLFVQLVKFHDLPEKQKTFFLKILLTLSTAMHSWLPIQPYIMTVIIILFFQRFGMAYWGIPTTHTVIVSIAVFLLSGVRLAKLKH